MDMYRREMYEPISEMLRQMKGTIAHRHSVRWLNRGQLKDGFFSLAELKQEGYPTAYRLTIVTLLNAYTMSFDFLQYDTAEGIEDRATQFIDAVRLANGRAGYTYDVKFISPDEATTTADGSPTALSSSESYDISGLMNEQSTESPPQYRGESTNSTNHTLSSEGTDSAPSAEEHTVSPALDSAEPESKVTGQSSSFDLNSPIVLAVFAGVLSFIIGALMSLILKRKSDKDDGAALETLEKGPKKYRSSGNKL